MQSLLTPLFGLQQVLAITQGAEGADDVHSVALEASAEHAQLMADLSKVNSIGSSVECTVW
jgi:hypothetical protein